MSRVDPRDWDAFDHGVPADSHLLQLAVGLLVAVSVVRVLLADVDTAIQFLSLLVVFCLVTVLFLPYTEPVED